ncbi:MBOAT family O-acyltransferase [Brachyspira hyodysenteriae]|uniref:MBOAT family O-acyltransferase n=1 Tax=Brachyspira hyodysenteriae TaxID=159 RepID=UPI0022CE1E5A|nr:MBOAT family O-acyltransferase [Brachyspira hyodysenteriae]MCZ9887481.1 MBOAT family protein [Brachyspira hyodysenteriae]
MVIADRASILVDTVFNRYYIYNSTELVLSAMLFAVQIYCDFASYSLIAIGTAKVMGIDLMENFNTPYFARSIKEFWGRWHISLSTWFRDYLYIPLGGNRCSKIRRSFNILVTFSKRTLAWC